MNINISKLRNFLLSGHEKHPWDHHYEVRRCDIAPGLQIIAWVCHPLSNGVPVISGDSQMSDALAHPEKYQWSGSGVASVVSVRPMYLTFTTKPFIREGHWFAKAIERDSDIESEYSLFSLGIVPDYVYIPKGDGFSPAGWNSLTNSTFLS